MISGVVSQGAALPRGALAPSGAYFDFEGIASPKVLGADSQAASSGLHTDADGFFTTRFARALVPSFKADDGSIFAPKLVQAQTLHPALYVAVDVLSLPAVALPGILQTHLHAVDDAIFAPVALSHGSLRPSFYTALDVLYAPTLVAAQTLLPNLYTSTDVFYAPIRRTGMGPSRIVDGDVFYAPAIPLLAVAGLTSDAETFFVPIVGFPATLNGPVVADITMSSGNLKATHTVNDSISGVRSAASKTAGKYYFEITAGQTTGTLSAAGVARTTIDYTSMIPSAYVGVNTSSCFLGVDGGGSSGNLGTGANGDIFGVAVDLNSTLVWFRRNNGNWNGNPAANPSTGANGITISAGASVPFVRFATGSVAGDNLTANFGQSAFSGSLPAGFGSWPAV